MISQRIRNFKLGTLHRTQVTGSAGMALLLTFAQDLGLGKEFCDQGGTEVYRLLAGAARFLAPVGSSGAVFAAMLRLPVKPFKNLTVAGIILPFKNLTLVTVLGCVIFPG